MVYDERCDRYFVDWRAYDQHVAASGFHYPCDDCELDFTTWSGLKEHWVQSPNHDYCQYCDSHVPDIHHHMINTHPYCRTCNRVFKSEYGLKEHYRQSNSEMHHYCKSCDRLFVSASNLRSHMNSSTHRAKDVRCPAGSGCGATFVSHSALVLHLENGGCPSGMNRTTVDRVVRQHDTNHLITDPSRMITSGSSSSSSMYDTTTTTFIATERSWNGSAYQCVLCPTYTTFRTLPALNQHLASPKHQDKVYICRHAQCQMRFSALSGLVQHVESDKCGVGRSKAVQYTMESVLGGMKRLTMG